MSMPGWYPDPGGAPGRYRYWDGSRWSAETTSDPQHASVPTPDGPRPPRGGRGGLVAAVAAVVVAVLALVWFLNRGQSTASAPEDTSTATPTVSAWNETSTPTPRPSSTASQPAPSQGTLVSCPQDGGDVNIPVGGILQAGALSATAIPNWTPGGFSMRWAFGTEAVTDTVYPGWFSVASVSMLSKADGFTSPKASAYSVMSCFASSSYYTGFTGRQDLLSERVTIDGHQGWRIRSDVRVSISNLPQVQGDVVDVIVVDTGSPDSLGLFVSSYTIGDTSRGPLVDQCIASLKVG
ncbi:MAG TPA: DUF2510 domain-containing protein [Propionibacteriaceae bacterium]|nr:DUF2510 domain-containing protein [Propionibacteriaceae bacterium]